MVLVVRYNMNMNNMNSMTVATLGHSCHTKPTLIKLDYHTEKEKSTEFWKIKETMESISNIGSTVYGGISGSMGRDAKNYRPIVHHSVQIRIE